MKLNSSTGSKSLYFTAFNSDLGDSIALIFFPALILDPHSPLHPLSSVGIVLGLLLAAYPFAQFFCAPLIGALSDKYGRKKILMCTMGILAGSFFLSGLAVQTHSLWLLFLSRLIGGAAAVNLTLSRAMLSDVQDEKVIAHRMAMSTFAQGCAWVVGALIGIQLAGIADLPWIDPTLAFYAVFGLLLVNALWVYREVKETVKSRSPFKFDLFESLRLLGQIFKLPRLELVLGGFFLGQLAYFFFFLGLPVFEIHKFQATTLKLSYIYLIFALAFNLGAFLISRIKLHSLKGVIIYPVLGSALLAAGVLFFDNPLLLYICYGSLSFFSGLYFCCQLTLISKMAGKEHHGTAFGAAQSCTTFSQIIGPIVTGSVITQFLALPMTISAILFVCSGALFIYFFISCKWDN